MSTVMSTLNQYYNETNMGPGPLSPRLGSLQLYIIVRWPRRHLKLFAALSFNDEYLQKWGSLEWSGEEKPKDDFAENLKPRT